VAVVLALLTAIAYGAGDYSGGRATRLAPALSVTATAHLIGLCGLAVIALLAGADDVRAADLALGAGGGFFGFVGVVLLYRGLATGSMAVVSPVSGVVSAAVPVLAGLVAGEQPGGLAAAGIAVALIAIVLVTRHGPIGAVTTESVLIAIGAGIGFGVFFVFLSGVSEDAGLWPLVAGRTVSLSVAALLALMRRLPVMVPRPALALTAVAGALDVSANVTFLLATQRGLLTIVAVVASMYPAITVLLALGIDKEHVERVQIAGLALAGMAIALCAM
jgi:drug/metabolite transporter (DMT)-like permease